MTILRSTLFNIFFFAMTILTTLTASLLRLVTARHVLWMARAWAAITVWGARWICGIRLEVSGIEHMPEGNAALIASQHQSAFDAIVWLTLVPRCCYVVKRELVRIPLFGMLIVRAGMIGVDRDGGATALRQLIRDGRRARDEDRQIVIFPEGTRAAIGKHLPLQPGIAALAAATGLPVIPVVTDSGLRWSRRAFFKHRGVIHLRLLPPLPAGLHRAELLRRLDAAFRTGAALLAVDNAVETPSPELPGDDKAA